TDSVPANDVASAAVAVTPRTADIAVTKVSNRATAIAGDTVRFTVTVANLSGVTATNIVVQDTLGPKFKLMSVTASAGAAPDTARSEERRVGKERSSRGTGED